MDTGTYSGLTGSSQVGKVETFSPLACKPVNLNWDSFLVITLGTWSPVVTGLVQSLFVEVDKHPADQQTIAARNFHFGLYAQGIDDLALVVKYLDIGIVVPGHAVLLAGIFPGVHFQVASLKQGLIIRVAHVFFQERDGTIFSDLYINCSGSCS